MKCSITFKLLGDTIEINDIPSEINLESITLEGLQVLLGQMPSNKSLAEVVYKLNKIAGNAIEKTALRTSKEGDVLFPENIEGILTVASLNLFSANNFKPNRTLDQVIDLVGDSVYEGPIKTFILKELSDMKKESSGNARVISFINQPIESRTSTLKANGFFQRDTGRIFLYNTNDNIKTETGLENLAHELIHNKLNNALTYNDFYVQVRALLRDVVMQTNEPPFVTDIVKNIIGVKDFILQTEEFLAYALTNRPFQMYLRDTFKGDESFLNKLNYTKDGAILPQDLFDTLASKYAHDIPLTEAEEIKPSSFDPYDSDDDDVPFRKASSAALTPITTELKGYSPETWKAAAVEVRRVFNQNKKDTISVGNKYTSYDLQYSEVTPILEANADTQILKLKQHDLVYLPQNLRYVNGTWELKYSDKTAEEEDRYSYRPVMYTYTGKNGEVMVRVPAGDETLKTSDATTFDIPAKFVTATRTHIGILENPTTSQEVAKLQSELLSIYKHSSGGKDISEESLISNEFLKQIIVNKFSNPEEKVKIFVPTNTTSVAFVFSNYKEEGEPFDQSYIQGLFDGVQPNDFVRVKFDNSDGPFTCIVSKKFGNMLEIVSSKGKKLYVKPKDLVGITYRESSHPELLTIKKEFAEADAMYGGTNSLDSTSKAIPVKRFSDSFKKNHKIEYIETSKNDIREYYNLGSDKKTEAYATALDHRRSLTSKLKPGDLIKVNWNVKGKISSGWYPVIGTTKNTVYFYTKKNNVQHVNITTVDPNKSRVLAVAYNNTKEGKIFQKFNKIYSSVKEVFESPLGVSGMMSKKAKNKEVTSLNQRYFIKEFVEEPTKDQVSFTKSQIKEAYAKVVAGDIVKVERKRSTGEVYQQWRVVTDVDEYGRAITVGYTNAYTLRFKSGKEFKDDGGYRVFPVNEDQILAVGYNLEKDEELGIEGHTELRLEQDEYVKELKTLSAPKFINSADQLSAGMAKYYEKMPAVYGLKNGKPVWATKASYLDSLLPTKESRVWLKEKGKEFYLSEGKFAYQAIWYPQEIEKGKLNKILRPGDIITEKYIKKTGEVGYVDSIVTSVYDGGLTVYKSQYDEETKKFVFAQANIFKNFKDASKSDYPSIHKIFIRKKGRGIDKAEADAKALYTKGALPTETTTSTKPVVKKANATTTYQPAIKGLTVASAKNVQRVRSANMSDFVKSKDSREKIIAVAEKLTNMYGIPMQVLTTSEIAEQFDTSTSTDRAFIKNGIIYINSDIASTAEPLHEMGHVVLGVLQKSDPILFNSMMEKIKSHPEYDLIAVHYPELDQDALNIEVFVTLFGEHYRNELSKSPFVSNWHTENEGFFTKIVNFVKGMFSSIFGSSTILSMTEQDFMQMSLNDLFTQFGDNLLNKKLDHVVKQYTDVVNTKVESLKEKLFAESKLIMNCIK